MLQTPAAIVWSEVQNEILKRKSGNGIIQSNFAFGSCSTIIILLRPSLPCNSAPSGESIVRL